MNIPGAARWVKDRLAVLSMLATVALLWESAQAAAAVDPQQEAATTRAVEAIRRAAREIVKAHDDVFVSTPDPEIRQTLGQLGATIHELDSSNAMVTGGPLYQVLGTLCQGSHEAAGRAIYWVWTRKNDRSAVQLAPAARSLNYFFAFRAVMALEGDGAFAIDKLLKLEPKASMIRDYCEITRLSNARPAVVVLSSERFSPWIGAVVTGPITWLASSPKREMEVADFAVRDMPPLLTYDVYWMGQVPPFSSWTFANQDMAAYEEAVRGGKSADSLVLVDRGAKLGPAAMRFLKDCPVDEAPIQSSQFRQMCFK